MKKLVLPRRQGEKLSPLSLITAICASFTLINYVAYLIKLIAFPEQVTAYIITFVIISGVTLPIVFRRQIGKITGKFFPVLKILFAAALVFYTVTFLLMCAYIVIGADSETPAEELPEKTVLVVYGAKVNGDENNCYPGNTLRRRLDKAIDIMERTPHTVCIVTGGQGLDEAKPEGDVMHDYMVSKGISEERIFTENKAKNTIENIEYSKEIIAKELKGYSIACVSTDFHIPRIQILCDKYGMNAEYYYYARNANAATLYTSLVREYMSYGKLIIFGHL